MTAARVIDLQAVRAQREQRRAAAVRPLWWVPVVFWVPVRWG